MRDYVKFLPLLAVYLAIVIVGSQPELVHDEIRYAEFAENLASGYYSPPEDLKLAFGPGLPLVLAPFAFFDLPWIFAKLLNSVFLYLAVVFFFKTLRTVGVEPRRALQFAYIFGVYPPFLRWLPLFMSENLAVVLTSGFILFYCKALRETSAARLGATLVAALFLGLLMLTKVFFGYVALAFIVSCLGLCLVRRDRRFLRPACIGALALLLCVPYLAYTYSLTSKNFYWATTGGAQLYWMSSPHPEELGDWFPYSYESLTRLNNPAILEHHGAFFKAHAHLNEAELDSKLKQQAFKQIHGHPTKYAKNWVANLGRLFFNYPYSYEQQKVSTYFFLIPNAFLVVLALLCVYPTWVARNRIPMEIVTLGMFGIITIAGSSLLSAYARFLVPVIPIVSLWICYVISQIVTVQIRKA